MKNKFLIGLIAIIYFPFALIFSLVWGIVCGVCGNIIGTLQDYKKMVVADYIRWKFFPKAAAYGWWSANNRAVGSQQRSYYERIRIMDESLSGGRSGPDPTISALIWASYYFMLFLPLRIIWGVLVGPIYAGIDAYDFFREKVLKEDIKVINDMLTDESGNEVEDLGLERV